MPTITFSDVDLAKVGSLSETVTVDPDAGRTTWSSDVTGTEAFPSESRVREFEPLAPDEPHDRVIGSSPAGHTLTRAIPVAISLKGN